MTSPARPVYTVFTVFTTLPWEPELVQLWETDTTMCAWVSIMSSEATNESMFPLP